MKYPSDILKIILYFYSNICLRRLRFYTPKNKCLLVHNILFIYNHFYVWKTNLFLNMIVFCNILYIMYNLSTRICINKYVNNLFYLKIYLYWFELTNKSQFPIYYESAKCQFKITIFYRHPDQWFSTFFHHD